MLKRNVTILKCCAYLFKKLKTYSFRCECCQKSKFMSLQYCQNNSNM
jgi:hypothetical protein